MNYKKGFAVQGIIRDISERKKLEQRISHLQKMESLVSEMLFRFADNELLEIRAMQTNNTVK